MKTSDFVAIATRELIEHIGPMAEFVVADSIEAAKMTGKAELSALERQTLMVYFKMTIPSFLDANTISQRVWQKLLQKDKPL
jgi:hypothetical protein